MYNSNIINGIEVWTVDNDVYGNGRYVLHFYSLADTYNEAVKVARKLGGRKYTAKWFGGGFVFTTSSPERLIKKLKEQTNEKVDR